MKPEVQQRMFIGGGLSEEVYRRVVSEGFIVASRAPCSRFGKSANLCAWRPQQDVGFISLKMYKIGVQVR